MTMSAHTVITHARLQNLLDTRGVSSVAMPSEFVLSDDDTAPPARGVSLAKIGDAPSPVRVLPLVIMIRSANDDGGWVSPMPRSEMQSMITAALRAGQYYYASGLSGVLHSA